MRYYGLYANAHRGKVKKASLAAFPLRIAEEELRPIPGKGWAEMIRKVYEADPMVCPQCGGTMKVIAFLTDYSVVDRIINHLKLSFVAERPPPPQFVYQEILIAAAAITAGKQYIFIIHKDFWGHDRNPGELGLSQFSTVENVKGNIQDRREADPQDVWNEQIRRCPGNLREEPDRRQNHLKVVPNFSVFSSGVSRDCPAGLLKKE